MLWEVHYFQVARHIKVLIATAKQAKQTKSEMVKPPAKIKIFSKQKAQTQTKSKLGPSSSWVYASETADRLQNL